MVETSLRGRPSFSTFLQSETSAGGDGLTYYDYQRFLRSQKVALLQERRAQSYIPGCKKTVMPTSRKVFQLKNRSHTHTTNSTYAEIQPDGEHLKPEPISNTKEHQAALDHSKGSSLSPVHVSLASGQLNAAWKSDDQKHSATERLPKIAVHRHRQIKSATARGHQLAGPNFELEKHPPRPKTVAGDRNTNVQTNELAIKEKEYPSVIQSTSTEDEQPHKSGLRHLPLHGHAWSEGEQTDGIENTEQILAERDALANAFTWGTTTQRAYDEVGWAERIANPVQPPMSTIERFPDPVSQRLTSRRYHSEPAGWQMYGSEWDYIQTRAGSFPKGPLAINYCNTTKRTHQIPGYLGCIPNHENMDDPTEDFQPALLIRSLKPRPTNVARRMNIPGYTGHVHWSRTGSAPTKSEAWWTTSERSHGPLPQEDDISPFCRNGIFSRMITTVSPHNPFNRIEL